MIAKLVARLIGAPLFPALLPWVLGGVLLALGALVTSNAMLRATIADQRTALVTLKLKHATLEADAEAFARAVAEQQIEKGRQHAERLQEIEQELIDAKANVVDITADLRAERGRRVRAALNCPARPDGVLDPGAGPGKPDAAADDPAAIIGRVDRIGAAADAHIRALQALVIEDRKRCGAAVKEGGHER